MRTAMLALAVVVLALASAASATQETVSGKLTISGSGTRWALAFDNAGTSTGSIKCWRYTFPPGVQATAIGTPPTGWQVGGNKPPPAPILGGRSDTGIPPGGRAAFPIVTDKPFDTSGPAGSAAISENCVNDVFAPASFGSQPPPPPPKTCKCRSLDVTEVSMERLDSGLRLYIRWKLRCSRKTGARCEGRIEVLPPGKKFAVTMVPDDGAVACKGRCRTRSTVGRKTVDADFKRSVEPTFWKGQTFHFRLKTFCKRGSELVANGTQSATIAFGEDGKLDKIQSDLNANGIPDGDEKK
jgi:hypothetical protein